MSTVGLTEELQALFAGAPALIADPYPVLAAAREAGHAYDLGPMTLLTHHGDVRWGLRDTDALSNRALVEGSRMDDARAHLSGDALQAFEEVMAFEANFPSRTDGEDHARLRGIAHRLFTPRQVATLEQTATSYVKKTLHSCPGDEVIDAMRIAFQLPLVIVADLLAVSHEDIDQIHAWSVPLGAANASTQPEPFLAAKQALREFRAYVDAMVQTHRQAPEATDLVATLMGAEQEERLSEEELAALFVQILFAGHETTTNLIGTGLLSLLRHREQWELLVEEPSRIPDAVEELMRYVSPSFFVSRLALRELDIDGTSIAAGQTVLLVIGAAHRDPDVFPDPDRLDVLRPESNKQLGFGYGRHFCLGASLARLEAQIVFRELVTHYPDATLAGDSVQWTGGAMLRHLTELPVILGKRR
jgi:cytochrome P450